MHNCVPCETLDAATEILREKAGGVEVREVPQGEPLFLFSSGVGKTRPINIFYDKGCSHVVFREGVPGQELPAVKTKNGPLTVSGVGDTLIRVNDDWAVLVDRGDGVKQVMQGVAVDKVTSPFPMFKLGEAFQELKESDPHNAHLQRLRVP